MLILQIFTRCYWTVFLFSPLYYQNLYRQYRLIMHPADLINTAPIKKNKPNFNEYLNIFRKIISNNVSPQNMAKIIA